jgi:hypothetical protein
MVEANSKYRSRVVWLDSLDSNGRGVLTHLR